MLKSTFFNPVCEESIILVCVIWNEKLLLPFFIQYYKALGVTHFVFIDNGSNDGTIEYLKSLTDINIEIHVQLSSYRDSNYGIAWVNALLQTKFKNNLCLVVDIDEILMLPAKMPTLNHLAETMLKQNCNIIQTILVDFYPSELNENKYKSSEHFLCHSKCFQRFTKETILVDIAPDFSYDVKGGFRHNLLNPKIPPTFSSVCLSKKSFFYFNFYDTHKIAEGMHWVLPKDFTCWWPPNLAYSNWKQSNQFLRFYEQPIVLAHFKFLKPNLKLYFQQRIERNQDWNDSIEYKNCLQLINKQMLKTDLSKTFSSIEDVYFNTVNNILSIKNATIVS